MIQKDGSAGLLGSESVFEETNGISFTSLRGVQNPGANQFLGDVIFGPDPGAGQIENGSAECHFFGLE